MPKEKKKTKYEKPKPYEKITHVLEELRKPSATPGFQKPNDRGNPNETPSEPDGPRHKLDQSIPNAKKELFPSPKSDSKEAKIAPNTPVMNVPGIGDKLGSSLQTIGYKTVGDLHKLMKKLCMDWLQSFGANSEEQEAIYNAVKGLDDD